MPKINRRHALAAGAAAVAAPTLAMPAFPRPAMAQAAAPAQAPGFYRYKVGDITVTAINDGFFNRPLEGFVRNAELSAVQAAMSAAFLPTNAVPVPFNTLVVETGGRVVLLDTGNGNTGAPTSGTWMANFRAAGFDPARVDSVIISHFHGDHINGIRLRDGTAVFPNAEIQVPAPEWAFWMSDERMAQAPEAARGAFQNCRRVFGPVAAQVKQFEPGAEVAPGITSQAAFGHSPGHTVFMIASGNGKLLYMADTSNHPALFVRNPDWAAIFDMDADTARTTRRRLLDMAASERTRVHFYHAPFPANGYIARDGNGYQFVPAQWTPAV
ncbi:MAG: MBL fold metallo-hydrolase [Phreatobacter sp.]